MKTGRHPDAPRYQRGLATVEMAIALPVLLLLLFALAEVGRLINQYDTLDKAVRDGARYAASVSSPGTTGFVSITSTMQTHIQNLVVYGNIDGTGSALLPGLTPSDISVSATGGNLYVEVSATYTYEPILGASLITFGLGTPIRLDVPLTSVCVMRAL